MTKDEHKHMVHPLTYSEIPLDDGRVLVLKERLEVPLERRHDKGIVWYATIDELGIHSYSHDQKIVEKDIADQLGALYMAQGENSRKLKDMVKEVRSH